MVTAVISGMSMPMSQKEIDTRAMTTRTAIGNNAIGMEGSLRSCMESFSCESFEM